MGSNLQVSPNVPKCSSIKATADMSGWFISSSLSAIMPISIDKMLNPVRSKSILDRATATIEHLLTKHCHTPCLWLDQTVLRTIQGTPSTRDL
jgi:hypothetical protein